MSGAKNGMIVKLLRVYGECPGISRRRRTWLAAISLGEPQAGFDPRMSEWGNPGDECRLSSSEYIGREKPTQGSETSQYLQEEKSIEIPPVVASEKGTA